PGVAALVRAVRPPHGIHRRQKEHVAPENELGVVLVYEVVDEALLDPVGQATRVKTVLQPALRIVVELRHARSLGRGQPRPAGTPWEPDWRERCTRVDVRFVALAPLVALAAVGCTPGPPSAQISRSLRRRRPPQQRWQAGAGSTQVFKGGVPAWLDAAGAYNN